MGLAPAEVEDITAEQIEQMTGDFLVNNIPVGTVGDLGPGSAPRANQPVFVSPPDEPPAPILDLPSIEPPEPGPSDILPGPAIEPPEIPVEIQKEDGHHYY